MIPIIFIIIYKNNNNLLSNFKMYYIFKNFILQIFQFITSINALFL